VVELRLDGVEKRYGETRALDGVSLSVADGEFFTLVGPSGCGKTTTLRLVAGFESPTAGAVYFGDRRMDGVPPEARNVGVVFQNYALFPHMSVGENVGYGLRFTDWPAAEKRDRVADLLALVDLDGTEERDPGTLSGGQRQRVALARALAPDPDVLLLDEPLSALDAQLRERLRMQIREIQSDLGVTTLYVTHDQEEAMAVSDRLAVLSDGRVEQTGAPRTVYREPATRFVAEFLGDNNVFEGTVVGARDGTATVRLGDASVRLPVDAPVGESVTWCVRPERLRVGDGENRLPARVLETEFLGDVTRVHCETAGERVHLRTSDPAVDGATGSVELGFDPADAHVL
jgi:thiamine transport system ATP-binding protein